MLFKGKDPKPKIFLDVWFLCCLGFTTLAWGLPTREAGKDQLDSLRGTREAGKNHLDSLGGPREAGKDQLNSLEAPGRQERIHSDSLGGTREDHDSEAPGRQERINWPACEAPGRHQGDL